MQTNYYLDPEHYLRRNVKDKRVETGMGRKFVFLRYPRVGNFFFSVRHRMPHRTKNITMIKCCHFVGRDLFWNRLLMCSRSEGKLCVLFLGDIMIAYGFFVASSALSVRNLQVIVMFYLFQRSKCGQVLVELGLQNVYVQ